MAGRFPSKTVPTGRITPSVLGPTATTNSTTSSISSSSYPSNENDQLYLERIKAREIISEAFLQVVRVKPDDPIEFLSNYFDSQCQTKPYERALTRLRLADPKHPSFESLLVELYSNFNLLNEDTLLLKGELYNKLLENLCMNLIWSNVKDHQTTLLSLVSLRPNDAVNFNVFKYGIQAILLAKEYENLVRSLYNSLANHAGSPADIDRSLCEALLQILFDSLNMINKPTIDAYSLHESVVKLSPHQLKQSLEQRWPPGKSISKSRITLEDFEHLAMPIYLKTIKKFS